MILNRYHAFGVHLLASIVLALTAAALVFWVWYPTPFAEAEKVTDIFLLLLGIDVILGPFMTLTVFNPAKKELKRDLTIIVLIQLIALAYGLFTVFSARPVYMVYTPGRFDMVYANELPSEKLASATLPEFKSLPVFGFKAIATKTVENSTKVRSKIPYGYYAAVNDLPLLPEFYISYADKKAEVGTISKPIEALRKLNPEMSSEIDALINKYAALKREISFLPLRSTLKDMAVIIAKDSGEILEINTLKAW